MPNYYENANRLLLDIYSTSFDDEIDLEEVQAENEWLQDHDEGTVTYRPRQSLDDVTSGLGIDDFSKESISTIRKDKRINEIAFDDAILRYLRHIEPSDTDTDESARRKLNDLRVGAELMFPGPINKIYSEYTLHSAKIKGIENAVLAHVTYVPDPRKPDKIIYSFIPDIVLEKLPSINDISTIITLCKEKGIERITYGKNDFGFNKRGPKKNNIEEVPQKRPDTSLPIISNAGYSNKTINSEYQSVLADKERMKTLEQKARDKGWLK